MPRQNGWVAVALLSMLGCNNMRALGARSETEEAPACAANPCGEKCKQVRVAKRLRRVFRIADPRFKDTLETVQKRVNFELAANLTKDALDCKDEYGARFCGSDTWTDWEHAPKSEMMCNEYDNGGPTWACGAEGYTTCYVAPAAPGPAMPPLPPSRN